jgi:serine/threonine protein kinase
MTSVKIRHHPSLVTLIGIAEYQNEYYIINEFCNGATLFDFLHESNHTISMKVKLSIAKQIARGMLFLHTNDPPIIHRDLKSLNILLVNKYNGEDNPQIKIADFGLSRDFASTYMTGTLGTYHWMAP